MIKYIVIALSLLLVGSVADVPTMFAAVHGSVPLLFVVITGFLADILPDFLWYWIGTRISIERLCKIRFFKQNPEHLEAVGRALEKRGSLILFGSKFVYWFGIPTQIMAGAHHYPLKKAVVANSLGSLGWLALLYSLAHAFTSKELIEAHIKNVSEAFTAFAAISFLIYFILSKSFSRIVKVPSKKKHK